jgi:P pilus assembly chaperone PapD
MKKNILFLSPLVLLLAFISACEASVSLASTRLVYHESDDGISLNLSNGETLPYLVQSWLALTPDNQKTAPQVNKAVPFIVTPPLFKMNGKDKNVLNILKTSTSLPEDRESVYYLNVKAIPGRAEKTRSNLSIAIKSTLKLFYRPNSLTDEQEEAAWGQLTFMQNNGQLIVKNPSPFFITFYSLNADDKNINLASNAMLSPFATQRYLLPAGRIRSVRWKVIGDFAQVSDEKSRMLP